MPAGLIRLFCDLATGVVPSAFWSGEGSLVTRLEFVRIGSYHRWGVPSCDSDVCHRCATGPGPEGSRAGAWALDLRRREWGRSRSNHDRRIQVPDVPQATAQG